MALVSCHRILSPWPHAAGQTLVYLYHVIKFSPVYLDPLEGLSRIVCHMWGEDMITLGGVEQRGAKWLRSHLFFAPAPAQTNSVAFSVDAIKKRWESDGVPGLWLVLSIAFFYHIAEFSQKGGMSCTWLTYLNKSLHPPLSLPFPVNAVGQD